jgi:hypothetical protein
MLAGIPDAEFEAWWKDVGEPSRGAYGTKTQAALVWDASATQVRAHLKAISDRLEELMLEPSLVGQGRRSAYFAGVKTAIERFPDVALLDELRRRGLRP